MKINVSFLRINIIFIFFIVFLFNTGFITLYQTGTVNNDGSGTINLQYFAGNSFLQSKKFIVGNFPFSEDLARQSFSSSNSNINKVKLDFDIKDSVYYMTVVLDFNDINKLSEAQGFRNVNAGISDSDSGKVFHFTLLKNYPLYEEFSDLSVILEFENKVLSTNGVLEGNKVTWGNRNVKNTDFSNDVTFYALLGKDSDASVNDKANKIKKDSCGLFSIELPLLFLLGVVSYYKRKYRTEI
ncbi:MAG: hypothetical protein JNJ56_00060 [Ignavibacteria bacterium]|nr:hypothetical protein [Ignavibacteria bacterium]